VEFNALIAGNEEDDAYARLCKNELSGLTDRISFSGNLSAPDVERALSRASVLVQPGVGYESFGMVVLEGICAGVPVIASRTSPLSIELEEASAAIGVAPEPAQIAEALRRALDGSVPDPVTALQYVEEHFSLSAVGDQWSSLVARIASTTTFHDQVGGVV
jgi:glycosyltransferase involved in cell wall biosynthesis